MITRRGILGAILMAPAIVRVGSLMPVRAWQDVGPFTLWGPHGPLKDQQILRWNDGVPRYYFIPSTLVAELGAGDLAAGQALLDSLVAHAA